MTRHDTLTRTFYCEACAKTLHIHRDELWHKIVIECRNNRCWRGVVRYITDVEWATLSEQQQEFDRWHLARCEGGG